MICIAIDGPAGSGKSSVSKLVAKKLGFISVDTGALYRAVAYFLKVEGVGIGSPNALEDALKNINLEAKSIGGEFRVFLNREDVTENLRSEEISLLASKISKIKAVRELLLDLQRDFAKKTNVVMDGRDIGTVIIPDAQVKIFLTASLDQRAARRRGDFGGKVSFEEVLRDLEKRDYQDANREISPLKKAKDAILIDSTGMSLKETVEKICEIAKERTGLK